MFIKPELFAPDFKDPTRIPSELFLYAFPIQFFSVKKKQKRRRGSSTKKKLEDWGKANSMASLNASEDHLPQQEQLPQTSYTGQL